VSNTERFPEDFCGHYLLRVIRSGIPPAPYLWLAAASGSCWFLKAFSEMLMNASAPDEIYQRLRDFKLACHCRG
jgi:hypothetical protein